MTLASLTALMSKVGRQNPVLVSDRNVTLFIQACIEEARKEARKQPAESAPLAPVDYLDV